MFERSLLGTTQRQYKRFYPLVLCLETLCKINEWHLAQNEYVPLYQSGVYYQEEPPGEEEWLDIPTLYKQGFGDCEDLACARVGELRRAGIAAVPAIKSRQFPIPRRMRRPNVSNLITLVHVMVLLPDNTLEDPSAMLGMRGEYR